MQNMFWILFIIQFFVQYVMYRQLRFIIYLIGSYAEQFTDTNLDTIQKVVMLSAFGLNIIISFFVKIFTSSGSMSGMSNLGASVILGFIMFYDIKKYMNMMRRYKYLKDLRRTH